ncbi:tRNA-dihydrouridine synthase B [Candidatus Methylocalor cossyra]|uniref:tRNA-dihydrouridine synthase B n=2 Tax=Candidatus Methylocalor cossyra TaxID=3108543 RepID=A0ABM9NEZ6_9GAMM
MHIGPYPLPHRVILAPMAGVTDRPFRILCRRYGADLAVSEMISARLALGGDRKALRRMDHQGEPAPRAVQILGNDPTAMAEAARLQVDHGAEIIDINMGCPAKKVCNKAAGSALLRDELLVARILEAVVKAVAVPVTLKIRTGWDPSRRNAVTIARIAENAGISAITVHGRTRACGFSEPAEFHTIASVKSAVSIPVIANGDIASPDQAVAVLAATGADAVMVGRAAWGRPWLFRALARRLGGEVPSGAPDAEAIRAVIREHLLGLYGFYGESQGVRLARKHMGRYCEHLPCPPGFLPLFNAQTSALRQLAMLDSLFNAHWEELAA